MATAGTLGPARKLSRPHQRADPLPGKTRVVRFFSPRFLRFANYYQPCENVSRPFVRGRLFSMDLGISEICETAAPVGRRVERDSSPSVKFDTIGRRTKTKARRWSKRGRTCVSTRRSPRRALIAATLFDLLERSVGDGRESVVTGVTKVPIISSGRRDKIRVVERAIKQRRR